MDIQNTHQTLHGFAVSCISGCLPTRAYPISRPKEKICCSCPWSLQLGFSLSTDLSNDPLRLGQDALFANSSQILRRHAHRRTRATSMYPIQHSNKAIKVENYSGATPQPSEICSGGRAASSPRHHSYDPDVKTRQERTLVTASQMMTP